MQTHRVHAHNATFHESIDLWEVASCVCKLRHHARTNAPHTRERRAAEVARGVDGEPGSGGLVLVLLWFELVVLFELVITVLVCPAVDVGVLVRVLPG